MKKCIIGLILCLCLWGCLTDSDDPPKEEAFTVKICVRDSQGDPVPNLDVFFINGFHRMRRQMRACTTIPFYLEQPAAVVLNVLDMEGNLVRRLMDGVEDAGIHHCNWFGQDEQNNDVPSGVYFANLKVTQQDTIAYQDDVMMYLMSWDSSHKNGTTNAEGIFETQDTKPFMNLHDLDSLQICDETGCSYGKQAFSDTTIIYVLDSTKGFSQQKAVVIGNGANEVTILWEPTLLKVGKHSLEESMILPDKFLNSMKVDGETQLKNNYPNPFN